MKWSLLNSFSFSSSSIRVDSSADAIGCDLKVIILFKFAAILFDRFIWLCDGFDCKSSSLSICLLLNDLVTVLLLQWPSTAVVHSLLPTCLI